MNERIQKLAKQAGMYVDLDGKPWPRSMSADECEAAYAKFAGLILEDVDALIKSSTAAFAYVPAGVALNMTAKNVKAYFGVES
jgi:hypothetical protein